MGVSCRRRGGATARATGGAMAWFGAAWFGAAWLCAACAWVPGASGQLEGTVIGSSLERAELDGVLFIELESGSMSGLARGDAPGGEVLAVEFSRRVPTGPSLGVPGFVELADGTRFTGVFDVSARAEPEVIAWSHPDLGPMSFGLEDVRRVVLPRPLGVGVPAFGAVEDDVVVYANGDRASGFVSRVGDEVVLELAGGGTVRTPLEFVAGIAIANEASAARGSRLVLVDGSVVPVESVRLEASGVCSAVLSAGGAGGGGRGGVDGAGASGSMLEVTLDPGRVAAIVPDASRVVALASLEPTDEVSLGTGLVTRRVEVDEASSPIGIADVVLPGAMEVSWDVPAGFEGSFGAVRATVGLSATSLPWGDVELIVLADGVEVERVLLDQSRRWAEVFAEFESGAERLTIRAEPGANGPVQDRVVISGGVVRLGRAPGR